MGLNKIYLLLILPLFLFSAVVIANNVLVNSFTANITVSEGLVLVSPTGSLDISLFPGETKIIGIEIQNLASVPLNAMVSTVENSNPNGVSYSVSYDLNPKGIPAVSTSTITATIKVVEDSPTGNVNLGFNLERTS